MRTRGYLRETRWQHSSAGPGGLWLMQTAPAGGYGEHMPGWDTQHPLIGQSISCPGLPLSSAGYCRRWQSQALSSACPWSQASSAGLSACPEPRARLVSAQQQRQPRAAAQPELHRTCPRPDGAAGIRLTASPAPTAHMGSQAPPPAKQQGTNMKYSPLPPQGRIGREASQPKHKQNIT